MARKRKTSQPLQRPLSPLEMAFGPRRAYAMVEAANVAWANRVEREALMRRYLEIPKELTGARQEVLRALASPRPMPCAVATPEYVHFMKITMDRFHKRRQQS